MVRLREGAAGRVYWDAQLRFRTADEQDWPMKRRRLGLAWQELDGTGGWRKRNGSCPEGWLDERTTLQKFGPGSVGRCLAGGACCA